MNERIKQIIGYSQMSTTVFADTIGISRSALVHLSSGRNQPSLDVLKKILSKFPEISIDWLMFGRGEMLISDRVYPQIQESISSSESENLQQIDLFTEIPNESGDVDTFAENASEVQNANFDEETVAEPVSEISQPAAVKSQTKKAVLSSVRKEKKGANTERRLTKILFIYSDRTFEIFRPADE